MTSLFSRMAVLAAEAGGQAAGGQVAGSTASRPGLTGGLIQLLPIILIFAGFLWFMSRSQKKRQQKRQGMLDSIKPKDDVLTIGGVHGRVVQVKGDEVVLRIDPEKDIKITVARSGISSKLGDKEAE